MVVESVFETFYRCVFGPLREALYSYFSSAVFFEDFLMMPNAVSGNSFILSMMSFEIFHNFENFYGVYYKVSILE